jgi:hypothetical protein
LPSKEDLDQPGFANFPGKEARGQPVTQLLLPGLGEVVYLAVRPVFLLDGLYIPPLYE